MMQVHNDEYDDDYVTVLVPTLCYIDNRGEEQTIMASHGIYNLDYLEHLCDLYQYTCGEIIWIEHKEWLVHIMSCEALRYKRA